MLNNFQRNLPRVILLNTVVPPDGPQGNRVSVVAALAALDSHLIAVSVPFHVVVIKIATDAGSKLRDSSTLIRVAETGEIIGREIAFCPQVCLDFTSQREGLAFWIL
jgi:hypothetical protein